LEGKSRNSGLRKTAKGSRGGKALWREKKRMYEAVEEGTEGKGPHRK